MSGLTCQMASTEEGAQMPLTNTWEVTRSRTIECYLQGESTSGYEEVVFECEYAPENGESAVQSAVSTVFACWVEPITIDLDGNGTIVNPSHIVAGEDAVFRIATVPREIPDSLVWWRVLQGIVTITNGQAGRVFSVVGVRGIVVLEVSVLETSDPRMRIKTKVIRQNE